MDLFDPEEFSQLARRFRLSTDDEESTFFLVRSAGTLHLRDAVNSDWLHLSSSGAIDDAYAWLGVKPREPREDETPPSLRP